MKSSALIFALAVFAFSGDILAQQPAPTRPAPARITESAGRTIFEGYCESCHGKVEQAPPPLTLKQLSPEKIYEALTTGNMKTQAANLTDEQKIAIAEWVGGRRLGSTENGDIRKMSNVCSSHPPVRNASTAPAWNGWSADALDNTRFQTAKAANLSPAAIGRLQLKWAFG
ncbi:MAG: cytochrome c, partial [Candidatus Korobacteraceae bacterium]